MTMRARSLHAQRSKSRPLFPNEVTERTDRLIDISSYCATGKEIAEAAGENFLAFLLSMAIEETQTAMRRATLGEPPPSKRTDA